MKKIIIVAVCLIIAALSIYKISGYLLEMLESQNLNDSLTKEAVMKLPQDAESNQSEQESVQETAPIIVDFEVLQTENKDIIAWGTRQGPFLWTTATAQIFQTGIL